MSVDSKQPKRQGKNYDEKNYFCNNFHFIDM